MTWTQEERGADWPLIEEIGIRLDNGTLTVEEKEEFIDLLIDNKELFRWIFHSWSNARHCLHLKCTLKMNDLLATANIGKRLKLRLKYGIKSRLWKRMSW